MTEVSTPAFRRVMAAECRSVCGVTCFSPIDGHALAAVAACLATSLSTASRESRPPGWVGNSGPAGRELGEPGPQDLGGLGGERGGPVLAALAVAADVRPGPEVDVLSPQARELGDPQPGLDVEQEQGRVAAAVPGPAAGCRGQRVD